MLRHIHYKNITPFTTGLDIQSRLVNEFLNYKRGTYNIKPTSTILSFEFSNVYTGGKRIKHNIINYPHPFHLLPRGGQITWHGNGQLVCYIILDLKDLNMGIKTYISSLLNGMNLTLNHFNLNSLINNGCFINNKKISSIGTKISRNITSFGITLNNNNNLTFLNSFEMCGLPNKATSLNELGINSSIDQLATIYATNLAKLWNLDVVNEIRDVLNDVLQNEVDSLE